MTRARVPNSPTPPARTWAGAVLAVLAGLAFLLLVLVLPDGAYSTLVVDNAVQLFAAAGAAVACALASRAGRGRQRRSWLLMAAGTGSWAAGQVVWSWYELGVGEAPLLSAADVGFLGFSLLGAAALLTWLRSQHSAVRTVRDTLDGALIAGALLVLSFGTTVSAVGTSGPVNTVGFVLSLAYALADVVLLSLALLTVSRAGSTQRVTLVLLAAGMGGLGVADSAYLYLAASGDYASGNAVSAGWVTGFLLIAAAALHSRSTADDESEHLRLERPSRLRTWLPYGPLLVAEAVFALRLARGTDVQPPEIALAFGLFGLVVVRQFLVLADNQSLMSQLRRREAELAHQAFHDPLTGLANRTQFLERLEAVAARHLASGEGYGVLYCDLDDFKVVNDVYGHAAGDVLLIEVGRRLRRCASEHEVVARLGGDEFAVLVDGSGPSAEVLADLVVEAVELPVELPVGDGGGPGHVEVSVGVSIGVAVRSDRRDGVAIPRQEDRRSTDPQCGDDLLKVADRSMYLAKAAGKGRRVVAAAR